MIRIMDLSGRMVYSSQVDNNQSETKIDLSGITEGVYLVTASAGKTVYTQKLIISR